MSLTPKEKNIQLEEHLKEIQVAYSELEIAYSKQTQCFAVYSQWAEKHISAPTIKDKNRIKELQQNTIDFQNKIFLLETEVSRLKKLLE